MGKKFEAGDIHAPVEDTDVPFALKLLVVLMVIVLGGISFLIVVIANNLGLLYEFMN